MVMQVVMMPRRLISLRGETMRLVRYACASDARRTTSSRNATALRKICSCISSPASPMLIRQQNHLRLLPAGSIKVKHQ